MTTENETEFQDVRSRVAMAALVFGVAAATAYMAQRVFELSVSEPIDPMAMLSETRVGFTWRAITAGWLGLLAAAAAYLLNPGIENLFTRRPRLGSLLALAWLLCLIASTYWWA